MIFAFIFVLILWMRTDFDDFGTMLVGIGAFCEVMAELAILAHFLNLK